MKEFWNARYASEAYAYGENPNAFFKEQIQKLKPGKLLLPAEGEGRNAVYAATLGWDVTAFDISIEAKIKAEKLANKFGVQNKYLISDFNNFEVEDESFDCIALIFAHAQPELRKHNHQLIQKWLKPGGIVLLQGFSKQQINNTSGGPQNIDMLFSNYILDEDFNKMDVVLTEDIDQELNEGLFHKGKASLISMVAKKI